MTIATQQTNIAERLAAAADAHGMWAHDVARFDDILEEYGLAGMEISKADIEAGHELHREAVAKLQRRIRYRNLQVSGETAAEPEATPEQISKLKPKKASNRKAPVRRKQTKKALVFDKYAVTAVLRWMGANGDWTKEDAALAILTLTGFNPADTTVRLQLKAGKDGLRGNPAPITDSEARRLRAATK